MSELITKEAFASQIHLFYTIWSDNRGLVGLANFLFRHAQEERNDMMKILLYILKRGSNVSITAIPAPPKVPSCINNYFEKIFEHEVDNTKVVYKIVKLSFEEEDWATWNFMQWFVKEQTEEEMLVMELLNKMKIAGGENITSDTLYLFDRDLENTSGETKLAQDVTTDSP